ncbi:MAG TPA: type II toxin-antitoxin system HicB family antitoxin [Thermoanaerobaculia bacterium]|nr:type II toxin-antitoxin system HicB family antitoxin [Thermoanaerobaculia bacterium]
MSDYVEQALALAEYDKLEDGSFGGKIPACLGVVAFGNTLRACEDALQSTLEDRILLGLKLRHPLPANSTGWQSPPTRSTRSRSSG